MNGNFLSSLVQGTGNNVGHMFQPQQHQANPQQSPGHFAPMHDPGFAYSPTMLPAMTRITPLATSYRGEPVSQHTIGQPTGNNITHYQDPQSGINSIGGRIGQYGGTIGTHNGHQFINANHNGQSIDPLAALRGLLGL